MKDLSASDRQKAKDARRRGSSSFRADDGATVALSTLDSSVFAAGSASCDADPTSDGGAE